MKGKSKLIVQPAPEKAVITMAALVTLSMTLILTRWAVMIRKIVANTSQK